MHARAFNTPIHLDTADPFSKSLLCTVRAKSHEGGGGCSPRTKWLDKANKWCGAAPNRSGSISTDGRSANQLVNHLCSDFSFRGSAGAHSAAAGRNSEEGSIAQLERISFEPRYWQAWAARLCPWAKTSIPPCTGFQVGERKENFIAGIKTGNVSICVYVGFWVLSSQLHNQIFKD